MELVAKGVIRQVNYRSKCVSPVLCLPKKGNKLRLLTHVRKFNEYCLSQKFSAESITSALDDIECDDLMITIDLKDVLGAYSSPCRGSAISRHVIRTVHRLGFVTIWDKSCIDPQISVTCIVYVLSSN